MSELGITVKKSEDFSEWYTQVILKSGLIDYAPIKGCIIFRELAYAIWEKIQEIFNEKIKKTGHRNVYFPLLIPESLLKMEAEHFSGFTPEVAWVTMGGNEVLEEKLAIRPTSETIICAMYAKWIKSWRDLPVKLNQWCSVVRWDTKGTKPFIRTREFLWQEGHTAHETKEDADREVMEILNEYRDLIENYLAIPVLAGVKSESEKFAGALYTTTLEAIMPDGKALQMATSHNLGQNFSKVFNIKFMGRDGKEHYVWQTSWGFSTRLIGAMVMVHGDDKGLIIPPRIAPIQVVIIPIILKDVDVDLILGKAREVNDRLLKAGISSIIDDRREYTPGWKFNHWELKGVPLRIEVGLMEVKNRQLTIARRDTFERIIVKEEEAVEKIREILEDIQLNLYNRAKKMLEEKITIVYDYNEFKEVLKSKGGFIKASWCGGRECEEKIKEETGATIRLIPFKREAPFSKCIYCNGEAKEVAYFAKSY